MKGGSQSSFILLGIGFIGVAPSGLDYTCKNQQRKVMVETWNAISKRASGSTLFPFWLFIDNLEHPVVTAVPRRWTFSLELRSQFCYL